MAYNNIPISFKNLLDEASRILGMQLPLYGSNFVNRRYEAWVELQPTRMRFLGLPTPYRDDSEQVAARLAVNYLKNTFEVEIIDYNFRELRETRMQAETLRNQVNQLRNQIAQDMLDARLCPNVPTFNSLLSAFLRATGSLMYIRIHGDIMFCCELITTTGHAAHAFLLSMPAARLYGYGTHTPSTAADESVITAAPPAYAKSTLRGVAKKVYPFAAIVGQDEMKLCFLLNMLDTKIGGVTIMGDRGTGKSNTVRSLVDLLPEIKVV
ncbi:hypothetical protein IFM89_017216 [Coptis chinensis]|uniref:Uncharacterized protein n=1 Tax=Coptis chinensis TaxID=261450 RepID=A0A835LYE1_9MAGN|nr:hypothetical protein IFM89_017216 [Coptis chinensis]